MNDWFDYDEMVTRNLGFVSREDQARLKDACVFIPGVGGMGGVVVTCLARAGVGELRFADMDAFEVSNLNRQMLANQDTIDVKKAEATEAALKKINPELKLTVTDGSWTEDIEGIVKGCDVVVNGCDDTRATLAMVRTCQKVGITVVDAFAATLPGVYVTRPGDRPPEEVFGYPSVGKAIDALTDEDVLLCVQREIEWVMAFSSSSKHVEMDIALEMVAGTRSRFSFAPMVWMAGCLMAYEAIRVILKKPGGPGVGGVFHNPWAGTCERPPPWPLKSIKLALVRRALASMM